ncbi:DUF1285 domain-containing protein [Roseospira goensis]|uniref:DUF1285 domain-containing protein n=1 Tax=Roseospira goensis TaxID=391922 RepID=A0A7W6WK63_9PROT|nr:DUF1285 domain-containing protein [Roseospira goensis]MBB4285238.1 hypothetical protein [Roseospira goensis]
MALDARDTGPDPRATARTGPLPGSRTGGSQTHPRPQEDPEGALPHLAALETPGAGGRPRHVCGDLGLSIDRDGVWHYQGSPIGRKEMMCLFASVLHRADDGTYWMVTPAEVGRVEVADVPFLAVEMFVHSCGADQCLSFRTNCDEVVTVDEAHPLRIETDGRTGEPLPYVTVRDGLDARLTRSVYYDLVSRGVEEERGGERRFGVWSRNRFFSLGTLDPDED